MGHPLVHQRQRLRIHQFGPLRDCEIEVGAFTCLIGPQASGKSTICKLIYYFQSVRDETFLCLLSLLDDGNSRFSHKTLWDRLRKRFLETWGPIPMPRDLHLIYHYNDNCVLEIKFADPAHRFISPIFPRKIMSQIERIFEDVRNKYQQKPRASSPLFGSPEEAAQEKTRSLLLKEIKTRCNEVFSISHELLFIPAGRSLVSTLSDQLQNIDPRLLDHPMRQFIDRINRTKSFFNKPIRDMILERKLTGDLRSSEANLREAQLYIERILKGTYVYQQGEGRIYVDDDTYTKINFASSGQQEATWILLSLFIVALEGAIVHLFIEEPEAHLFPDAQKEIVDFISFIYNRFQCLFTITTHSPYILSAINNLLYAHVVGNRTLVSADRWLDPDTLSGYYINQGGVSSLMDEELHMLKTETIDSITKTLNEEYDALFEFVQQGGRSK